MRKHKLEVCTYITESLTHQSILILKHSNRTLLLVCHWNIPYNRNTSQFLHISTFFNFKSSQTNQENNTDRQTYSQYQSNHINHFRFRRYRTTFSYRLIYNLSIVGCSGQSDGVFFTLLQKHQIKSCFDFLLPCNTYILTFLPRSITDTTRKAARFAIQISLHNK